jgi:hypothetical protein
MAKTDQELIDAAWERHKAAAPSAFQEVLRDHWVHEVVCDHEAKTDRVVCSCSRWRGDPMPNVGAAIDAWAAHVVSELEMILTRRED